MDKEYALKIENAEHGLIFHIMLTEEEAKKTNVWVGAVQMIKKNEQYIEARYMSVFQMYQESRLDEDDGGFELIT